MFPSLLELQHFQEAEAGMEVPDTTTDSGDSTVPITDSGNEDSKSPKKKAPVRLGWVVGVKIRCMLNIWGVILFLRLSWITSQAGILLTCLIVMMSVTVTTATALSISAIATNGRIISGGTYFLISRSLGPEIGAPIGMVFSFANALACALNTVGFAEVDDFGTVIVDSVNDVRIVGVITVTILLFISLAGMEWESKTQILFFIALMISFASYLVGTVIPHGTIKQAQGIFGYREIFVSNLKPDWRGPDGNFFRMFAIFFPATTGILSGVNICGDLKDPSTAIPKGTLLAIFWTTISYLVVPLTVGACVLRDASGNISDILTVNSTGVCVGLACNLGWNFTDCTQTQSCRYGLANSLQVLGQISAFYYLITLGVFAASLSSALGFLVSAPKIFQCLCRDNIYPYIGFFGKGYGKNDEPLRAYILCYVIAVAFIVIGGYDLIVFHSCFYMLLLLQKGWRPAFHYYSKWAALYGAVIAVLLMFLFTWWAALVTFSIIFFLFEYVNYTKPKVNWGSSVQASTYNMALSSSVSLSGVEDHIKNFRPQCLVLTGPPNQRPALVDFVASFTKHISLMICGDIIMVSHSVLLQKENKNLLVKWMNKRKVRSFYTPLSADGLRAGARNLLQASGLGKLKPNTLVLGFKSNWRESSPESIEDYINTIYDTFDSNYNLCILRMMDGLDIIEHFEFEGLKSTFPQSLKFLCDFLLEFTNHQTKKISDQGKKTIDVYWIADDGGLTLLVPYLLTRRKRWCRSKVRVFIVGDEQNMDESHKHSLTCIPLFLSLLSLSRFVDSVAPFRLWDEQQEGVSAQELKQNAPWKISDKQFEVFIICQVHAAFPLVLLCLCKCDGFLRSLPVPQSDCPSALYMAWLDTLTCGLHCPAVLIRGNQQNVLTFYCQ
uniref:Solute carrier family 12 member 10, tandem duplicate 1 n=1 Tax=Mastacembelus armatus TaxID=205130 RepID=A0A7N8XEW3_9TELE